MDKVMMTKRQPTRFVQKCRATHLAAIEKQSQLPEQITALRELASHESDLRIRHILDKRIEALKAEVKVAERAEHTLAHVLLDAKLDCLNVQIVKQAQSLWQQYEVTDTVAAKVKTRGVVSAIVRRQQENAKTVESSRSSEK